MMTKTIVDKMVLIAKALEATNIEVVDLPSRFVVSFEYQGITSSIEAEKDKFVVHPYWPKYNRAANNYEAEKAWRKVHKTINISQSKSLDKIASEIKSRFDWDALVAANQLFVDADMRERKALEIHKGLVKRICDALGEKEVETQGCTTINVFLEDSYKYIGEFNVTGQTIELKLRIESNELDEFLEFVKKRQVTT